ncbi:MAG: AAA family ATPase, partial [Planctomycetota bacterium]
VPGLAKTTAIRTLAQALARSIDASFLRIQFTSDLLPGDVLGMALPEMREGRPTVSFEDLRALAHPALRHRLLLNFEGGAEGIGPDRIIDNLLEEVAELPPELAEIDRG